MPGFRGKIGKTFGRNRSADIAKLCSAKLMDSIPRRVNAVMNSEGASTAYLFIFISIVEVVVDIKGEN